MHWMRRPPVAKWLAMGGLLTTALLIELSGPSTVRHPYAAEPIAEGDIVGEDDLQWREIPEGILPAPPDLAGMAARDLTVGEPLLPSSIQPGIAVPDEWWAVPVPIPPSLPRGAALRLVVGAGAAIDGVIVEPAALDEFGVEHAALVAVAPFHAELVARAASDGAVTVLVKP